MDDAPDVADSTAPVVLRTTEEALSDRFDTADEAADARDSALPVVLAASDDAEELLSSILPLAKEDKDATVP